MGSLNSTYISSARAAEKIEAANVRITGGRDDHRHRGDRASPSSIRRTKRLDDCHAGRGVRSSGDFSTYTTRAS